MAEAGKTTTEVVPDEEIEVPKKDETTEDVSTSGTTITFEINNTFWHKLCNHEKATKIISITFSGPLSICIVSLVVIATALNVAGVDDSQRAFYLTLKLIVAMIATTWALSVLLYVNVEAAKMIIMWSFAFWIKVLSITQVIILHFILAYYVQFWNEDDDELGLIGLDVLADVFLGMALFCAVMIYSLGDGLYLKRRYKIAASAMLTIGSGLYTIDVMFGAPDEDETVIHIGSIVSYSLYGGYSSAIQVLWIFLAQSALFMFLRPKKCINIGGTTPLLKWK